MIKSIQSLPYEIQQKILPYLYQTQNKNLLMDINSFTYTKSIMVKYYKNKFKYENRFDKESYLKWFVNDIYLFINKNKGSFYRFEEYTDNLYKIVSRSYNFKNKYKTFKNINKFLKNINKYDIKYQLNYLWGLLYTSERYDFMYQISNIKI